MNWHSLVILVVVNSWLLHCKSLSEGLKEIELRRCHARLVYRLLVSRVRSHIESGALTTEHLLLVLIHLLLLVVDIVSVLLRFIAHLVGLLRRLPVIDHWPHAVLVDHLLS